MTLEYRKLSVSETAEGMKSLNGWAIQGGKLCKKFVFETYKDGVVFASAVGYVSDKLNHHPDITIGYGKVKIAMNTHDVAGISPYDFELARRIETL